MNAKLPPGPPDDPFGRKHALAMQADPGGFGIQLQIDYGDVAHFKLGPVSCFQLAHPEHIEQVLVTKSKCFRKPSRLKLVFGRFEGNGLVVSDGPLWKQQHRWVRAAFDTETLQRQASTITDSIHPLIEEWSRNSPIDVCREMRRATLKIILRTLFSDYDEKKAEQIRLAIEDVQHWATRELHRVVATPRWMPLVGQPKARIAIATVRQFVRHMVRDRKSQAGAPRDVLSELLHARKVDAGLSTVSDRQLCDELVTLLLAGHETSAAAVSWTVWQLAKENQIQDSMATTVQEAVGDRRVDYGDLSRLSVVTQAINEAMRLHPPVYLISREAAESVEIAGYKLRPGSLVFINLWVTHRDPRWFPAPLAFDPGRFTAEASLTRPKYAFLPFGGGPRACLGRDFAILTAALVVAMLLQRCRLRLSEGQQEPDLEWQLTLHPKGKLLIACDPRGL